MAQHTIRQEVHGVFLFVGAIWCVFLVGLVMPFQINSFGVTPRSLIGLIGIAVMPFLHADLAHIISNTLPLVVLLVLLAGSRANSWAIVAYIVFLNGLLLWLLGRPWLSGQAATHVGASGLIYGLTAFLIVAGFLERRIVSLAIAILVGFLFGGTLLSGVLPTVGAHVSWEGHLFGAIAGGVIARQMVMRNEDQQPVELPAS